MREKLAQILHGVGARALDEGDLGGVIRGDKKFDIIFFGKESGRHGPSDTAQPSVERQLADEERRGGDGNISGGGGHGDGDRQIEQRPLLGDVGGSEIYRHAPSYVDAGGAKRGAHPLARLFDGGVGQADHRYREEPPCDLDLDFDRDALHSAQRQPRNVVHIIGSVISRRCSINGSRPSARVTATKSTRQKPS